MGIARRRLARVRIAVLILSCKRVLGWWAHISQKCSSQRSSQGMLALYTWHASQSGQRATWCIYVAHPSQSHVHPSIYRYLPTTSRQDKYNRWRKQVAAVCIVCQVQQTHNTMTEQQNNNCGHAILLVSSTIADLKVTSILENHLLKIMALILDCPHTRGKGSTASGFISSTLKVE